jgi:hypothetical protein
MPINLLLVRPGSSLQHLSINEGPNPAGAVQAAVIGAFQQAGLELRTGSSDVSPSAGAANEGDNIEFSRALGASLHKPVTDALPADEQQKVRLAYEQQVQKVVSLLTSKHNLTVVGKLEDFGQG